MRLPRGDRMTLLTLMLILSFLIGGLYLFVWSDTPPIEHSAPDIELILNRLSACESRNSEDAINPADPITASHGVFQFKVGTVKWYAEKYNIELPEKESELLDLIYTTEFSRDLAKRILEDGQWKNWYNCLHKYYE